MTHVWANWRHWARYRASSSSETRLRLSFTMLMSTRLHITMATVEQAACTQQDSLAIMQAVELQAASAPRQWWGAEGVRCACPSRQSHSQLGAQQLVKAV